MDEGKPFGGAPGEPPKPDKMDFKDKESDREKLGSIASTMRILEDRYSTMRKKLQLTDNSLLEAQREFEKERELLEEEIIECKQRITSLEEELDDLKKHIVNAVSKQDFRRLRKYIEYWDISSFLTREEAETLLNNQNNF